MKTGKSRLLSGCLLALLGGMAGGCVAAGYGGDYYGDTYVEGGFYEAPWYYGEGRYIPPPYQHYGHGQAGGHAPATIPNRPRPAPAPAARGGDDHRRP